MRASLAGLVVLAASTLATSVDASPADADAYAGDDIARVFAGALEAALADPAGEAQVVLYTVDEPRAFRIWSAVPPMLASYPCARSVALAVESGGQQRGVVWLGVCRADGELPPDLLATAAVNARAAAAEREVAPVAAGLGELVRQRRIEPGASLTEVTVVALGGGAARVLRTALVVPDGAQDLLVLQYEALRLCATGAAPLCSAPQPTLDALASRLLRELRR